MIAMTELFRMSFNIAESIRGQVPIFTAPVGKDMNVFVRYHFYPSESRDDIIAKHYINRVSIATTQSRLPGPYMVILNQKVLSDIAEGYIEEGVTDVLAFTFVEERKNPVGGIAEHYESILEITERMLDDQTKRERLAYWDEYSKQHYHGTNDTWIEVETIHIYGR